MSIVAKASSIFSQNSWVLVVYPVSTTSAKSYCQRKVPSGNKTDHAEIQQQFTTNLYGVVHVMQAALRFRMLILHLA